MVVLILLASVGYQVVTGHKIADGPNPLPASSILVITAYAFAWDVNSALARWNRG